MVNRIIKNNTYKDEDRVAVVMLASFFVVLMCMFTSACGQKVMTYIDGDGVDLECSDLGGEEDIGDGTDALSTGSDTDEEYKQPATICVHVCGAVINEGVYELEEGKRVADAVRLAGGMSEDACTEAVNLAQKLEDAMQIYIPTTEEIKNNDGGSRYQAGNIDAADGKIDINSADIAQLKTLTGIGDAKAKSIIEYRECNGKFSCTEDVKKVSGIGESIYAKIKDEIVAR